MLDKLEKQVCRTVGPSLAASLGSLAHRHNMGSLSLFYWYYFGRCSFELTEVAPRPCFRARSTRYSNKFHFSVTIPTCYKDVCINVSTNSFRLQLDSGILIHKDICACLFSIHNTINLSCHEQVCLSGLRFERYFSHHRAKYRFAVVITFVFKPRKS